MRGSLSCVERLGRECSCQSELRATGQTPNCDILCWVPLVLSLPAIRPIPIFSCSSSFAIFLHPCPFHPWHPNPSNPPFLPCHLHLFCFAIPPAFLYSASHGSQLTGESGTSSSDGQSSGTDSGSSDNPLKTEHFYGLESGIGDSKKYLKTADVV